MNTTTTHLIGTAGTSKTVHAFKASTGEHTFCSIRTHGKTLRVEEVTPEDAAAKVTCKRCAGWL